jgi:general stress protein 26
MRVPESHVDILSRPVRAVLSTFEPGGRLRSSFCMCRGEGDSLLVTSVEKDQVRQMRLDPRVSVMIVDPGNVDRWLCVQGDAALQDAAWELSVRRVMVFPTMN